MVQITEQTYEEKVKMYRKISKDELIKMLIECNRIIAARPIEAVFTENSFGGTGHGMRFMETTVTTS